MTLIFDYDGTLHDTSALYGSAVRSVLPSLESMGYRVPEETSDEALSVYLGMRADEMWRSFMPSLPEKEAARAAKRVGTAMIEGIKNGAARLYSGVPEALCSVKQSGARCVILSNCGEEYLAVHRVRFSLDRWFDAYFPAEAFGALPKAGIVPVIMQRFPDSGYAVIGDRASDIAAAEKNGIPSIGCEYGFGTPAELAGCSVTVSSPEMIPKAIKRIRIVSLENF